MDLALASSFRQIPRVRWVPVFVVFLLASAAHAAPASDPAFLGIGMAPGPGGCTVTSITPASPAQDAGLRSGDDVFAIDKVSLGNRGVTQPCDMLTGEIVAHRPGDEVHLTVRRGVSVVTVKARLSTRSEVLHRRFFGEHMVSAELLDLDNDKVTYDLAEPRGGTKIVGWFLLDSCVNCGRVFDRIADAIRIRMRDADQMPTLLAVTATEKLASLRKVFTASVPLALAEPDVFDMLALKDSMRISFMVIDCRGVVRYVAPVAPDADDLDAAVDDILAAAEQAEYQRTRRN
jgi:hypothetical protein